MATVTLILPLEATTVNNPSDSRCNSRTLILPLDATTVNNPSDSRINNGVTAGATVERHQEHWQSKMEPRKKL